MTAADHAAGIDSPSLSVRYILAVSNSLMAAVIGTLTLGVGAGVLGALVMGVLPFWPVVFPAVIAWVKENPFGACLGAFLLFWIAGTIVGGLAFAFGVALVLAPTMLAVIVLLTLVKPTASSAH